MEENFIIKKIQQQLETVSDEFEAAKTELESIVNNFISDINRNLKRYFIDNVKREMRRSPAAAEQMDGREFDEFRDELNAALEPEVARIVTLLDSDPTWYDDETFFLDMNSRIWKTVKSIEEAGNAVLKKHNLLTVNMKNWSWLSAETDALITMRFSAAKKEFSDKRKQLTYLQNRYVEETRLASVFHRLENL